MMPGLGNINPKKMQGMLKQLGVSQEEILAERVTIETSDKNLIIDNPNVQKITMQGQESLQITGTIREEEKEDFNEQDIELIVEKTGKTKEEARVALQETKDIAEAITKLSG